MNMSIECSVTECKYNNKVEKYCNLNTIRVTKDQQNTTLEKGYADCASFEKG